MNNELMLQILIVALSLSAVYFFLTDGLVRYTLKTPLSHIIEGRITINHDSCHKSFNCILKRRSRESLHATTNGAVIGGLLAQIQNGAGSRSALSYDYMGMINFCLEPSDSGLSGPSTTKLLNEVTNEVFRVIMIGFEPAFKETLTRYRISRHTNSINNGSTFPS